MDEDIEKIENKIAEVEIKSFAMDILSDYKAAFKRTFVLLILVLFMWFGTLGYLMYILNSYELVETTVEQETEEGDNNYIGNDGDINGKADS